MLSFYTQRVQLHAWPWEAQRWFCTGEGEGAQRLGGDVRPKVHGEVLSGGRHEIQEGERFMAVDTSVGNVVKTGCSGARSRVDVC